MEQASANTPPARIARLEAIPVRLPFRERVADSWGEYYASHHGIIRITDTDGLTGLGEISFAWFDGAHALCAEVNRVWAPRLAGQESGRIGALCAMMDTWCSFSKRHLTAKAGVEMALWDLLGKRAGMSVSRLMGGRRRERVTLTGGIPMAAAPEMADIAQLRVTEGYRELKLKVGLDDAADLAGVRAVRARIPSDIRLRADANMAWQDRRHALHMMDALWDEGVAIVEQPVGDDRLADLAWLRAHAKNRVLIDEGVWDVRDAKAQLDAGTADMLHLYTCEAGGLIAMQRIADLAALYHVPCTIGSMPEGLIGAAASAQAAAAMDNLSADASDIRGFTVYAEDVARERLEIQNGELLIPDRPGLGVTLDEDALERLRVPRA